MRGSFEASALRHQRFSKARLRFQRKCYPTASPSYHTTVFPDEHLQSTIAPAPLVVPYVDPPFRDPTPQWRNQPRSTPAYSPPTHHATHIAPTHAMGSTLELTCRSVSMDLLGCLSHHFDPAQHYLARRQYWVLQHAISHVYVAVVYLGLLGVVPSLTMAGGGAPRGTGGVCLV